MADSKEGATATTPPPLQHQEDGVVMVIDSDDRGEVQTMTRMPSEEALVAALRGHSCWVCGASADTHDANLEHLMTHLQAAPPAPLTPPYTSPPYLAQAADDAMEVDEDLVMEASAGGLTTGESPPAPGHPGHDAEDSPSDPSDGPRLTDPVSESPGDPPTLTGVAPGNVPDSVDDIAPGNMSVEVPDDVPVNIPDDKTLEVPVILPNDVLTRSEVLDCVPDDMPVDAPNNAPVDAPSHVQDLCEDAMDATPSDAADEGPSPMSPPMSPGSDSVTQLSQTDTASLMDTETEAAALLDSESSFPPSPEDAPRPMVPMVAMGPLDPDVVVQPAVSAALYGAPSPLPASLSDSDFHTVLLCGADELAMETTALFAEEGLGARTMVPSLQVLDSALEGLAADVAPTAAATTITPPSAAAPQQPPTPEVTFLEPPRFSYTGKSSARQRPSLDLIVSRLFSQRAAIEAAEAAVKNKGDAATLLDENSNHKDAVQHDFQAVVRAVVDGGVDDLDQGASPDLADVYAVTAASLDAQHPNSLVCAICLKSFEHRDALLRHVEDEVRDITNQAKRGRTRPRRNPPRDASPRDASPDVTSSRSSSRSRPVRAVAKKAKLEPAATKWTCTQCQASFSKRAELREHVAVEHKEDAERPHKCPVCAKRFARRAHLEQHQLLHTDERPFQCGHCGMAFRRKDRLVVHVRTHTPRGAEPRAEPRDPVNAAATTTSTKTPVTAEAAPKLRSAANAKPLEMRQAAAPPAADADEALSCMTCSKKFSTKSSLRRHVLAVHARTMPHVCRTCGKNCMTKKRLLAHVARHIADRVRTLRCGECGDVLDDQKALFRHRRTKHAGGGDDASQPKADVGQAAVPSSAAPSSTSTSAPPSTASSSSTSSTTSTPSGGGRPNATQSGASSKPPQKYVFKIVSKNGSSRTANMAAKLLPTLASDFAAKRNQGAGTKSPSKVVYMVMSKNSKPGAAAAAGSGDKPVSKVLMQIVSKDGPCKKVPCLVPRTPPKVGFKVVSKVVPLDSSASKEDPRLSAAYTGAANPAAASTKAFFGRPATPTAWPTPALSPALRNLPGVTPLFGAPPLSSPYLAAPTGGVSLDTAFVAAPPLGAPYLDGPYQNAAHQGNALHASPYQHIAFPGASYPGPQDAPLLGAPYLDAPLLDAPTLDAPVLELAPQGDATPALPKGPWNEKPRAKQFPAAADGRYLCDVCGRRFMSEALYSLHVQVHKGKVVKTFECQCCGQRFVDKEVLRAHWQTHM